MSDFPRPTPSDCQEVVMIEPVFVRFLAWADSQGWDVFRIPLEDDDPDALPAYAISPRSFRTMRGGSDV